MFRGTRGNNQGARRAGNRSGRGEVMRGNRAQDTRRGREHRDNMRTAHITQRVVPLVDRMTGGGGGVRRNNNTRGAANAGSRPLVERITMDTGGGGQGGGGAQDNVNVRGAVPTAFNSRAAPGTQGSTLFVSPQLTQASTLTQPRSVFASQTAPQFRPTPTAHANSLARTTPQVQPTATAPANPPPRRLRFKAPRVEKDPIKRLFKNPRLRALFGNKRMAPAPKRYDQMLLRVGAGAPLELVCESPEHEPDA